MEQKSLRGVSPLRKELEKALKQAKSKRAEMDKEIAVLIEAISKLKDRATQAKEEIATLTAFGSGEGI